MGRKEKENTEHTPSWSGSEILENHKSIITYPSLISRALLQIAICNREGLFPYKKDEKKGIWSKKDEGGEEWL